MKQKTSSGPPMPGDRRREIVEFFLNDGFDRGDLKIFSYSMLKPERDEAEYEQGDHEDLAYHNNVGKKPTDGPDTVHDLFGIQKKQGAVPVRTFTYFEPKSRDRKGARQTYDNIGYTTDHVRNGCASWFLYSEKLLGREGAKEIRCPGVLKPNPSNALANYAADNVIYVRQTETQDEQEETGAMNLDKVTMFGDFSSLTEFVRSDELRELVHVNKDALISRSLEKVRDR